jgi:hypothetical protein
MSLRTSCDLRFVVAGVIALTGLIVTALACRPAAAAAENPAAVQNPSAAKPSGKAGESAELTYHGPGGLVFRVTAAGLSEIRLGDRIVARGDWSSFNADFWFKEFMEGKHEDADRTIEKSIEVLSPRRARVRHVKKDTVCTTDYTFDGEDVLISARVQNNDPDNPINAVGFQGLEIRFQRAPSGLMIPNVRGEAQYRGVKVCYPGMQAPGIGGSYAVDDSFGVGLSPWKTGWDRTLVMLDYVDYSQQEKRPQRQLIYVVVAPVPARGSRTFDLKLRVSPNRDWKHLLEPYREHFRQTFGPVRYKADYRWIAMDCINGGVSPGNPYGYMDNWLGRRFDRPEGIREFCDKVIPALKENGGQGVIIWAPSGGEPRGALYRPDFDVLPPVVEANWATLAKRFHEAGLKLGVSTSPALLAVRQDWKTDMMISSNADDPGHREMILRRFQNMVKKGCTLFYLDCVGYDLEHVKMMRFLRENLGPDVLTFSEYQCDAMLVYSGGFSETNFLGGTPGGTPRYQFGPGPQKWEIYQWLVPGAQITSRTLHTTEGKIPQGFESVGEFQYRNRLTPLLDTGALWQGGEFGKTQSRYLDASGGWKK